MMAPTSLPAAGSILPRWMILSSAQNLLSAALFVVGFIAIVCIAIPLLLAYLCLCWRYRGVMGKLAGKKPVASTGAKPVTVTVIDNPYRRNT